MMASIMHSDVMKMDVVNTAVMRTYVADEFEWRCDRVSVLTIAHPGLRRTTISIKAQQRQRQ
jgi:hypothetical protein